MKVVRFSKERRIVEGKHFSASLVIILCLGLLAGCGRNPNETAGNGSQTSQQVYTDIRTETRELTLPLDTDANWGFLTMQFLGEEIIQFWGKRTMEGSTEVSMDVYLFRGDGSGELLLAEAQRQQRSWFIDRNGNYYLLSGGIARLDGEWRELWRWKEGVVRDICQLPDGRIMLLVTIDETPRLAELNPETGEVSVKRSIALEEKTQYYIGAGQKGLLLLDKEGFWEVDADNGSKICVMPFEGSSYSFEQIGYVSDFREVADNGGIELLKGREVEIVKVADVRENRTAITVRNTLFSPWQNYWTEEFNRRNDSYYVVLETCDMSEQEDYRTRTGVELATGKGPDIIGGDILRDVNSLIEKGGLVNLAPYMAASGIREEDYFPAAFDCWRDGEEIYVAELQMRLSGAGLWISEDLLRDCGEVDIETLVNALYHYPEEKVVFKAYWTSDLLMDYAFFAGTETLWGMVDWEKGTCDFSGELFARMLEVAKRYGYSEQKGNYPALAGARRDRNCYDRESIAQLKTEGKRYIGFLTDDGCHSRMLSGYSLMINSNSPNKEGAWEYLSFMLGEEAQSSFNYPSVVNGTTDGYAMLRSAFAEVMANELEEGAIGTQMAVSGVDLPWYKAGQQEFKDLNRNEEAYRELYDIREETVQEIESILEDVRHRPIRTEPIREIIYEEAADYFAGSKSIEEVVKVIQNRVQLYLREHK